MYRIFEELCTKNNVTPYKVCKETGLTTSTISNWKAGRYVPKQDKMQKIADYFGVSLEYLTTGTDGGDDANNKSKLRDARDIAADINGLLNKLGNKGDGPALYNGNPLTDESAELLRENLKISLRQLMLINKENNENGK
ncbi:helix-turn-helix transcriptional regulator [Kineothrix sedimenti]|uniref:Helix-turn-helix transcriptional regulator n=1 Tax=Kineothrix sedimenti TaxID=3123317 RepID=A0ABZ3ESH7_9FIRM